MHGLGSSPPQIESLWERACGGNALVFHHDHRRPRHAVQEHRPLRVQRRQAIAQRNVKAVFSRLHKSKEVVSRES